MNKLKKRHSRKISSKITLYFSIITIATLVVGCTGIFGIIRLKSTEEDLYRDHLVVNSYLTNIQNSIAGIQTVARDAVINSGDETLFEGNKTAFGIYNGIFQTNSKALIGATRDPDWLQKLKKANQSYENEFAPEISKVLELAKSDATTAKINLNASNSVHNDISKVYSDYITYSNQVAQQQIDADNRLSMTLSIASVLFTVLGLLSSIFLGLKLSRSISKPVKELAFVADEFAENGNMDIEIQYSSSNELGLLADSLRSVFKRLHNMINEISSTLTNMSNGNLTVEPLRNYNGDFAPIPVAVNTILDKLNEDFDLIKTTAEQVNSSSTQVSNGAQELAQGATEQASSIEELSASISEISERIKENSEHIANVTRYIDNATVNLKQSNDQMLHMVGAMNEINDASEQIGKINQVIDNIAFQTNILALNAAVEAARAGAAGKGFAVVADEVRNLATKSAEAAKQTNQLIQNSMQKVQDGSQIANSTAKALETVTEHVTNVDHTIRKIENASSSQASAIVQITQGIEQVSAVVQNNSATAEESAAASEELSAQAEMQARQLARIKLRSSRGPEGLES
ncbi:MAG TPA: methyl-accepting chemotaxis protein [Caproiciproducens sp.]|nr:methyl-accepting chemotaxis protein [Caproiciproducens sp.]